MIKKKVIIDVPPIHADGLEAFEKAPDVEVIRYRRDSDQPLLDAVKDAAGIMVGLSDFDEAIIKTAPNLEIIAKHGVGYDNIDIAAATKRKIPVAFTPYANSSSVAEYTVGYMLAVTKKMSESNAALKDGTYRGMKDFTGTDIRGKTVGIIGIGRIGSEVVRMCRQAFHMTVLAYDPLVTDAYSNTVGAHRVDNLDKLLAASDFVTVHCPLTPLTRDIIAETELKKMKKSAFLFNTARGGIVNEAALLRALDEGWIEGAALDVTIMEPPGADHPLLNHEKMLVTPHIAANTDEAMSRMATMAADEILRVLAGEKPINIVNPEIYL